MSLFIDSLLILFTLLIIARYLKRWSRLLQRLFIPSSLIAGIAGLILGPQVVGVIPESITSEWSQYPKFLISVVFAGLFLGKTIPKLKEVWRMSGPMIAFGSTMAWGQYVIGILLTILILTPFFGANPLAGSLIEISFSGGHGTAAGLAPTFQELGWSEGTDIALGLATLSIFVALFSGIIFINIHSRKHGLLKKDEWEEQKKHLISSGYNLLAFTQKFNTNPRAVIINLFAFAAAILLGWALLKSLVGIEELVLSDSTSVRFFAYVPLFPLAMIGGLLVQLGLRKIKRSKLVQRRTAQIYSSIALDLLIVSAISTVSLDIIRDNFAIFGLLAIAGVIWIVGCFFFMAPRFFKDHWFERGITDYGQGMGMTATGLLMNRLADPSNKLKIRESFAYKQLIFEPFLGGGLITAGAAIVIHEAGSMVALVSAIIATLFWFIVGLRLGRKT